MSTFKQSTNALHAGYDPLAHQGAQAVPIYQTSSYVCSREIQSFRSWIYLYKT